MMIDAPVVEGEGQIQKDEVMFPFIPTDLNCKDKITVNLRHVLLVIRQARKG